MKLLPRNQAITSYTLQQPIVYDAEIVELYPDAVTKIDLCKCPTAADIVQAERELEADRKLPYWDWIKSVLGY